MRWVCKGIFSDHFIKARLHEVHTWPGSSDSALEKYRFAKDLWEKRYIGLERSGEEATRQEFIDKVLARLGYSYWPNLDLPVASRRQVPDYLLFGDEATKDKVFNEDREAKFRAAIGLLEAKPVNAPLDSISKHEFRFPHQQIRAYLMEAADWHGKAYFRWGILSSGSEWRLYSRDAHPSSYFAFLLAGPRENFCSFEEFKVFLALFSPEALTERAGKCLLDEIRAEAVQFQANLEQQIRKRIAGVIQELANGFWTFPENRIGEAELKDLYDNCLILLYRLLFILYAESRALLPVRLSGPQANPRYREHYSLQRLIPRLQSNVGEDDGLTSIYDDLEKLFGLINGDHPSANKACGVPRYNGGLFDPKLHPKLTSWKIGDKSLSGVLRRLMFSPGASLGSEQQEFNFGAIDYADLEVRQLGDIYEGLLGGHLELAMPGANKLIVMGEHVALQESGTFYTPDWVVKFLVDTTLSPLISAFNEDAHVKAAVAANVQDDSFANLVLTLNVVDPAMGSGHFLVRATEWIADRIVEHPTTKLATATAEQESRADAAIAYWRRRVVESCIYGVDLNPLAVELTKLSLWLTCIAFDEPLSFLDHHLRTGNALIGTRIAQLGGLPTRVPEQATLSLGDQLSGNIHAAISVIADIEKSESSSLEVVKTKETRWNEEVVRRLTPFRDIADLWCAAVAGLPLTHLEYYEFGRLVLLELAAKHKTDRAKLAKEKAELLKLHEAQFLKLRNDLQPFHWELEFPEAFFDESGDTKRNPGFDAILGNPPYISTQTTSGLNYRPALHQLWGYVDDTYVHFIFSGFSLLRDGGQFGFITSDTFFTLATKTAIRELLQNQALRFLVQCDPFEATVDAAMFVFEKRKLQLDAKADQLIFIQARYETADNNPETAIPELLKEFPVLEASAAPFTVADHQYSVEHGVSGCLRVHRTHTEPYRQALKRAFFEPRDGSVLLYNRYMAAWKEKVHEWWEDIQDSKKFAKGRQAIEDYQQNLKPGELTLLGLVAEGGQGMRTGNNGRFLAYLSGTKAGTEALNRQQQLATMWSRNPRVSERLASLLKQDNTPIQDVIEQLKEEFDAARELRLQKGEVYKVIDSTQIATQEDLENAFAFRRDELLARWSQTEGIKARLKELQESTSDFFEIFQALWTAAEDKQFPKKLLGLKNGEVYFDPTAAPRIATIFRGLLGKRTWLPFRKGDPEGHRWASEENLYIDWGTASVRHLQTASESRWQGYSFFLTPGVTWTLHANHVALKARTQPPCVFDASGSRFTPGCSAFTAASFLAILNSDVFSFIIKKFIKNTQDYEVNDLRMAPLVVPSEAAKKQLDYLAQLAVEIRTAQFKDKEPTYKAIAECRALAEAQLSAPSYLRPSPQRILVHTAEDCLEVIQLAVNWRSEKLYGVEGLGPFSDF